MIVQSKILKIKDILEQKIQEDNQDKTKFIIVLLSENQIVPECQQKNYGSSITLKNNVTSVEGKLKPSSHTLVCVNIYCIDGWRGVDFNIITVPIEKIKKFSTIEEAENILNNMNLPRAFVTRFNDNLE